MINKSILIVGGTGCGKSILCNVLTNTDEFKEGEYTVSETLKIQIRCFGLNGIEYSVVDTVGIGNINVTARDVLSSIIEKINSISEGISQVLLVTDGRFQAEEIEIYDLLKDIFKAGFVTIVRTKFASFQNEDECKKDKKKMLDGNNRIAEITRSCKVIHVDNPPTDIKCENVSDVEDIRKTNEMNSRYRKKSREKLLNHLKKVCQNDKTKTWKKIFGSIKMIKKK